MALFWDGSTGTAAGYRSVTEEQGTFLCDKAAAF
jgi:hypothetical protein